MKKVRISDRDTHLVLDYCARCGGIWFELGEVQQLRHHGHHALWSRIDRRADAFRMSCHECHSIIDRNCERCPTCGWSNVLQCPSCDRPLTREVHEGMCLDVCRECRGVWFDHAELSEIWKASLAPRPRRTPGSSHASASAWVATDVLLYSPDLLFLSAHGAGMVVEGVGTALANAPQAIGGVADAAGDAAAGVFEFIAEIIGGIFS